MREITTHVFGSKESPVLVQKADDGYYDIKVHHGDVNKLVNACAIEFQHGLSKVANGITIESLIAVAADQLLEHQKGNVSCSENAWALTHLSEAMKALHDRTARRTALGIHGTMQSEGSLLAAKAAALADSEALRIEIMRKCDSSEPVTAEELRTLEAARRDPALSADTRNRISSSLVKADLGGLLIDSEV